MWETFVLCANRAERNRRVPWRPVRATRHASSRSIVGKPRESGFFLVWAALMLTALIGIGGFAVDVGNWYLHISRLQRAADAGALAGAIHLPGDPGRAFEEAESAVVKNRIDASQAHFQVQPLHNTQLKVTTRAEVPSIFISLVGLESISFSRSAVAEFHPYIPMGSPSNVLGIEPNLAGLNQWEKDSTRNTQGHYWLNISAAGTNKSTGDRWNSGPCGASGTANCKTTVAAPYGNIEYSTTGQHYIVRVPEGVAGTLAIEAFDPGFSHVGDNCDAPTLRTNNTQWTPGSTNPYQWGAANPACTGDNITSNAPTTVFQLFTPEQSPGGSQPINDAQCTPQVGQGIYPGVNSNIISRLNTDATFRSYFRAWSRVCTINIGGQHGPGDYVLNVRNSTNPSHGALNRFALRAGFLSGSNNVDPIRTAQLQLFAKGRLVIYAKDTASEATFYIARIHPAARGQTLTVSLFDIGDATNGAALQFIPPDEATAGGVPMTTFPNCKYTRPGQNTYIPMEPGCTISGMTQSTFDGKITNIQVTLPSDYTCDESIAEGCWTRLKLRYYQGSVTDTTSWMASLNANPVRLVPDRG